MCGADLLLSFSTLIILLIGSVSLVTCIRKKVKMAAKVGKQLRGSKTKAQVHPL